MKRKLKMHLWRDSSSTWCGRDVSSGTGWKDNRGWKPLKEERVTHSHHDVTCRTCLKAFQEQDDV